MVSKGQNAISINDRIRCLNAWLNWRPLEGRLGQRLRLQFLSLPHSMQFVLGSAGRERPGGESSSGVVGGFVVETHQLVRFQGHARVSAAVIVAEFDFIDTGRPGLHDGTDLAAHQSPLRQILDEGDHGEQLNVRHGKPCIYST